MNKGIKRIIFVLSVFLFVGMLGGCEKEPELTADYETLTDAVTAFNNGENIKGKTVWVTASFDSFAGIIYQGPDLTHKANISVLLVIEEATQGIITPEQASELISEDDPILNIKEGETVLVKIDSIRFSNGYQYAVTGTYVDKIQ